MRTLKLSESRFLAIFASNKGFKPLVLREFHDSRKLLILPLICLPVLFLLGCDPMAPVIEPTPQVIIVTSPPTQTPLPPTATPIPTRTPVPTPTEIVEPTVTPYPCDEERGQTIAFDEFRSAVAGENLRYRVHVPPCYFETQKRYPVLYLLHGLQNNELQWDNLGVDDKLDQGIRLGTLAPMIVVMPYTGVIGNENIFPPDPSYETVMLKELLPAVERDFCTWSDRDHRAIGGISRGGFWAFSIALRHPDVFGIVGGHSAFFDPANAPPANNPLDLALNSQFLKDAKLRMYLDNGAQDLVGANLELFSSRLSARGIQHTYIINPMGEHEDEYWESHLEDYLTFYARDWERNVSALPSCLEASP